MDAVGKRSPADIRLLECWLPLAEATSQLYGWNADGGALQTLVLAAAPALAHAQNVTEAHAILIVYYTRQRSTVQ